MEIFLFMATFLKYMKVLLFCGSKINMTTSRQNPVFTLRPYSGLQIKAAMQRKLKFNIVNLIIVHDYLTVLWIGFKWWYYNWLLIIRKHAVMIMLPGWWRVKSLSYPGTRFWEQMAPVTINESRRTEMETEGCLWTCGAE